MMQLRQQIIEWQDEGDFLIVGGDWNHNIREESWKRFWQDLDLVTPQALADSPPISTYARGSHQIDNLYVSASLISAPAGFVSLEHVIPVVDHSALWADISDHIIGFRVTPLVTFLARRLKTQDPHVRERYLNEYKLFCTKYKLFNHGKKLWQDVQVGIPLAEKQKQEFEEIDHLCTWGMQLVEK